MGDTEAGAIIESQRMSARGYVSTIGFQLIQPMLDLIEELGDGNVGYPNEVQTSVWENGYSTAIIVLSALILESAANRVRYLRKEPGDKPAPDYLRSLLGDDLGARIDEVFVARDVVAHNHMWEGQIDDIDGVLRFCGDPVLVLGKRADRYRRSISTTAPRLTNILQLNLIPSRIWRDDVLKVVNLLEVVLETLEQMDASYYQTNNHAFTFRGEYVSIRTAVERINRDRLGLQS
jgi:hypothetical protein